MKQKLNVPQPDEIDPKEFFDGGKLSTNLVARYVRAYLDPLVLVQDDFYHFENGLWRNYTTGTLKKIIVMALKKQVSSRRMSDVLTHLRADCFVYGDYLDPPDNLINLANGVVDTSVFVGKKRPPSFKNILKKHDPRQRMCMQVQTPFNPNATAPTWEKCVSQILGGDPKKIRDLQMFSGYLLMPATFYEKALVMSGVGGNGKSTVIKVFANVLGSDNVLSVDPVEIGRAFSIPYMKSKLMILMEDYSRVYIGNRQPQSSWNRYFLKLICGDRITGERKFRECIDFMPTAKIIITTNEDQLAHPGHGGTGIDLRLLTIRFDERFWWDTADRNILPQIYQEREGVLTWMMRGAAELVRQGGFK